MGIIIGGTPPQDLILDGQSVSLYVGGNPPTKVWPTTREVVQITLGTGLEARDQLRAALADRGLDYQTVTEIPFDIELVRTGSARNMFYGCAALTTVPNMDTSNVTDMSNIFHSCSSLTTVPDLDTGNATNMSSMFYGCASLTTVPDLDTSKVTRMSYMFYNCAALTHVPDMDTSNVTEMPYMFYNCSSLTDGNVRLFGRHPEVSTVFMIRGSGLTREPFVVVQITLGTGNQAMSQLRAALSAHGLDYRTVEKIPFDIELVGTGPVREMFWNCSSLTLVPAMDTSQVTDMYGMFSGCSSLTTVPAMDTRNVTNMPSVFNNCSSLTSVPAMDTSNATNMLGMFYGCASLTAVPDMDTRNVTNMSSMFRNCSSLTDGNVRLIGRHPNVNTSNMITGSGLTREPFVEMVQITLGTGYEARDQFRAALTERGLNYQTVKDVPFYIELVGIGSAQLMFQGCSSLTHAPDMDTIGVTNMSYMFDGCSSLTTVPPMDTNRVTNMSYMFDGCSSLTTVPPMDTNRVTNMRSMFRGCSSLSYVPSMDTSNARDLSFMFYNCWMLFDGSVHLIGVHSSVPNTSNMITGSGLTREPFYDSYDYPIDIYGNPIDF